MADYFQSNLDGTPWDRALSRTALSTRQGLALQLDGGVLQLLAPPNPPTALASAPVSQVTVNITRLASMGAGVLVDFGSSAWMVDFGRVGTRAMTQSAGGMFKRFLGVGTLSSVKQGRALRDGFVETMAAYGARIER